MQISFVGTQRDFVDAQKTHAWRRYSAGVRRLQKILSPIFGLFFIVVGTVGLLRGRVPGLSLIEIVFGLYVASATSVWAPILYRRAYRRRQTGEDHPTVLTFSDQTIECDWPGRSHSVFDWALVKGVIESPTTVLLYVSPVNFLMIPKRAMQEEQLAELRMLLREKGVPATSPKVVRR